MTTSKLFHKILLPLAISSTCLTAQENSITKPEKLYLSHDEIFIDKHSIFIKNQNDWITVNSLHKDLGGFFVLTDDPSLVANKYHFYHDTDVKPYAEIACGNCHCMNLRESEVCINCGSPLHDQNSSTSSKKSPSKDKDNASKRKK